MISFPEVLKSLISGKSLSAAESEFVLNEIMDGKASSVLTAAFLTALAQKGETHEEIVGMARAMRSHVLKVRGGADIMDTCGTGGSGKNRFNVSTITAFILSSQGVRIAKHGNRASSRGNGSFDLLEKLGINITLSPVQVEQCLAQEDIAFLFAPLFHPAMKYVVPIRKELGIRTVFNILGPLCNPAGAAYQLLGTISLSLAEKLSHALSILQTQRAIVVAGSNGLDEATTLGPFSYYELNAGKTQLKEIDPGTLGFKTPSEKEIEGGDVAENEKIFYLILEDHAESAKKDMVLLNAGLGFTVAGKTKNFSDGITLARKAIDQGSAFQKFKQYKKLSLQMSNNG